MTGDEDAGVTCSTSLGTVTDSAMLMVTPEETAPNTASTPVVSTSLVAALTPWVDAELESSKWSSTFMPFGPPALLMSSRASSKPFCIGPPKSLRSPLNGTTTPTSTVPPPPPPPPWRSSRQPASPAVPRAPAARRNRLRFNRSLNELSCDIV